jgi:hypothetical protein
MKQSNYFKIAKTTHPSPSNFITLKVRRFIWSVGFGKQQEVTAYRVSRTELSTKDIVFTKKTLVLN